MSKESKGGIMNFCIESKVNHLSSAFLLGMGSGVPGDPLTSREEELKA